MQGDPPGHPGLPDSDTTRLEAALDRIGRAAARRAAPPASPNTAHIAARLDQLIADLRGLLDT